MPISKSWLSTIFGLSFITGAFLSLRLSFLPIGSIIWLLVPFGIFYSLRSPITHIIACFIGLIIGSFVCHQYFLQIQNYRPLPINRSITISGTIIDPPEIKNNHQQIVIGELFDEENQKCDGHILVYTSPFPSYFYHQTIQLTTSLSKPENFTDDFSYTGYLALRQIFYLSYSPQIKIIPTSSPHLLPRMLTLIYSFKNTLQNLINNSIPFPAAGLLAGLLLGVKNALPNNIYQDFRQAGLTHIIVVSGFNLTIFATLFLTFFRGYIHRFLLLTFTIICITAFTILTGAESSILRALFMTIIMIGAPFLGRRSHSGLSIILAACIMIALNPFILWYDAGFHLSFLATIGIVYFSPIISPLVDRLHLPHVISDTLGESLAAMIPTMPYIAHSFHQISLVAIFSNIIILPFIPIIMLLGFISITLSAIHSVLALIPNIVTTFCLNLVIHLATFFARLPFSAISISFSNNRMIIVYIILTILVCIIHAKFLRPCYPQNNSIS